MAKHCKELADQMKITLVVIKLTGHYDAWWELAREICQCIEKPPITSWENMNKHVKGHFLLTRSRS